jgi:DNA-binding transcriptional ArsR family regulator
MTVPEGFKGLRFPCECVSSRHGGYSDPWAAISQNKLLPNGTKEEILNLVAGEPKTISQVAEALGLSAPSVYAHVSDMLKSELLREAVEWEKTHPAERYYEPNFPVFRAEECAEFEVLCQEMARAFRKTGLASQGWELKDVTQCLYANVQRKARSMLEESGLLASREKHSNGVEWVFWAEEPKEDGERK